MQAIKDLKSQIEESQHELEVAQRQGEYEKASKLRYQVIPDLQARLPRQAEHTSTVENMPESLLHDRVTSADVGRVVSKSTGIPVQNLLRGVQSLMSCEIFSKCDCKGNERNYYM